MTSGKPRFRFSLRIFLLFFVAVSILVPACIYFPEAVGGCVVTGLVIGSFYLGFLWYKHPEVRSHRWKAPLMLGLFALGVTPVLLWASAEFDIYYKHLLWYPGCALLAFMFSFAPLAILIATPLRFLITPFEPGPRMKWWIAALLNGAIFFGPVWLLGSFVTLYWVAPAIVPRDLQLGLFVILAVAFIVVQWLAFALAIVAIALQCVSGWWCKVRTSICFLYGVGWLTLAISSP